MIRTHTTYNYDRDALSVETGLHCPEPSLAQQHMKEEVDINNILYKYTQTGVMPFASQNPTFGDFSNATDYHSAMNAIKDAQNAFNELPASLRERFDNDPSLLIDFLNDENNQNEAYELGLVNNPQVVSPIAESKDSA